MTAASATLTAPEISAASSSSPSGHAARLPSLDGMRACSILLVLIGHFTAGTEGHSTWRTIVLQLIGNADLGVTVFFVISGFLITWLLLQEETRRGRIDLFAFYRRRAYRIWPAYFTLLAVVAALAAKGLITTTRDDLLAAAFFVWNYVGGSGDNWTLGHTWSLAVEEQFYLLWPACLLLVTRGVTRRRLAVAIIVASPVIRLATYLLFPSLRGRIPVMLHTRADSLMFGCLLALLLAEPAGRAFVERVVARGAHRVALPLMLIVTPILASYFRGAYMILAGRTLEGAAIACVIAWVVLRPDTLVGRALNSRTLIHLGVLSYSLYLWQQLFAHGIPGMPGVPTIVRLLILVAVAEASYRWIESPMLRLKAHLSRA
jgi:peptidoglycan/LPS O-acetylase OafA/YrhL